MILRTTMFFAGHCGVVPQPALGHTTNGPYQVSHAADFLPRRILCCDMKDKAHWRLNGICSGVSCLLAAMLPALSPLSTTKRKAE